MHKRFFAFRGIIMQTRYIPIIFELFFCKFTQILVPSHNRSSLKSVCPQGSMWEDAICILEQAMNRPYSPHDELIETANGITECSNLLSGTFSKQLRLSTSFFASFRPTAHHHVEPIQRCCETFVVVPHPMNIFAIWSSRKTSSRTKLLA